MYIEFEGQNYLITVNPAAEKIIITAVKNEYIQISSPPNLPQSELLVYLRNNKKQLINTFEKHNKSQNIEVFDRSLSLVIKTNLRDAYLLDHVIYSPDTITSLRHEQKVKEKLLLHELMKWISHWEEIFGILINEIKLRQLKTNHFTVCYKNNNITFSKSLSNRNLNFIAYIVATAIFDKLKIDDSSREELLDRYVSDWKFSAKINSYDRSK